MYLILQTLKDFRVVEWGPWVLVGGDCIHGRCRSETAGVCMESVQGVSLSCAKAIFSKKKKKKIGSLSSLEITLRGVEEGARGDCSLHALKQHLKCKSSSIDPHPPYHTPITICPQVICLQNEQCLKCCAPAVFTQELFFEPNLIRLVRNFNCVDK